MNGEPIKFLKLSGNEMQEDRATEEAAATIEDFLDQIDSEEQVKMLGKLIGGESLVGKFGEEAGRELAAYRLALLMRTIGEAVADLSDIFVFDVVVPGEATTTGVELSKVALDQTRK
jgi:hypothetical protein